MPQFDSITFLNQILSIFFLYLVFFLLFFYIFLPRFSQILKIRVKKSHQNLITILSSHNDHTFIFSTSWKLLEVEILRKTIFVNLITFLFSNHNFFILGVYNIFLMSKSCLYLQRTIYNLSLRNFFFVS